MPDKVANIRFLLLWGNINLKCLVGISFFCSCKGLFSTEHADTDFS